MDLLAKLAVDFRSCWALCRSRFDGGHEGIITGRDAFSLRSSITDPQGVAQPPLQSNSSHRVYS